MMLMMTTVLDCAFKEYDNGKMCGAIKFGIEQFWCLWAAYKIICPSAKQCRKFCIVCRKEEEEEEDG